MTLHLTGCWYPGVDDETLADISYALSTRSVCLVWDDGRPLSVDFALLCADALEHMAGTPKEMT